MSHENLAVQLADSRPANIFPLRAKIRAGSVFPNDRFPLPPPLPPRDKIHANNGGSK